MADFCITKVRYNANGEHIDFVVVREQKFKTLGPGRAAARGFIADLIRLDLATFETKTENADGSWNDGSKVHVIDDIYLSTDRNTSKKDI